MGSPRFERRLEQGLARAAVRAGTFGARRRTRARVPSADGGCPRSFEVFTFVTDDEQYAAFRTSFVAAGFDAPLARFVALRDRRTAGGTDPYELIGRLGGRADGPYSILVHQDVRLDRGAGAPELLAALGQLDALDSRWALAGNAGGAADLHVVRRLTDPYGGSTDDQLPAPVVTLDENFLVFNPRARIRSSPGLQGFHFYGTDACLNAARSGGTAYVVDFPVTHLSRGRRGPAYDEMKERFLAAWNARTLFAYVRAPTEIVFLSRFALLRRIFASPRMLALVADAVAPLQLDTDAG
jgi:hypothetical protein